MCEFKGQTENPVAPAEKMKLTVATVECGGGGDGGGGGIDTSTTPMEKCGDGDKSTEYFDNALAATKFGKFNYVVILVSGLILANVLLETLGMGFVLPVSECDLRLSLAERGILSAIGFAGIISSSHLWGFLADTTGRRNIIRPTLLLGFVVTVASSFATNFWLLVVLRYINGFCISGGSATTYAYLGEFHTTKNRSRAIMGAAFIFGVGAIMLPGIAWLVINQDWRIDMPLLGLTYKPWRLFIVVCGIPGLLCGLALFLIPESPKFLLSQGKQDKVLRILSDIYHYNTGKPRDTYPVSHVVEDLDMTGDKPKLKHDSNQHVAMALLRSMWQQTQPLFNRRYVRTTTLVCLIQFGIFVTSNGLYMWFPHMLNIMANYMNEHPGNRTYICDVMYEMQSITAKTELALLNGGGGSSDGLSSAAMVADECSEKLEMSTYETTLLLEVFYAVGFAVIGVFINKVSKMWILFICLTFCGVCGVLTVLVNMPTLAIYLYLVLLLCGLGINVLGAATVDLYPTRLRAMAICISLMMGRLGSIVGANVVSALLSNHCETAFIGCGALLMVCGVLGFLIPKPSKLNGLHDTQRRNSLVSMTGN